MAPWSPLILGALITAPPFLYLGGAVFVLNLIICTQSSVPQDIPSSPVTQQAILHVKAVTASKFLEDTVTSNSNWQLTS